MSAIQWSEKYQVHVREFDEQHKILFRLINNLNEAMMAGKGKVIVEDTLKELITYTQTHFKDEERMMSAYQYPGLALHRIEHEDLVRRVEELASRMDAQKVTASIELLGLMRQWIQEHIKKTDMQYSAFFKSKGIE